MRSMNLVCVLALFGGAVPFGAGCVAHARGAAYAEPGAPVVFSGEPTLVEVESGVWVVRDYEQPVYFVDDDYWVYRDDVWYRAHSYDRGWVRVEAMVVPSVVVRRDHRLYVRYHGAATAQTRVAPRRGDSDRRPPPPNQAAPNPAPPEHVAEPHGNPADHDGSHEHANDHRGGRGHDDRHEEGRDEHPPGKGKKHDKDRGRKR